MKDKKTFGAFIKEKRLNKNYSQKDLAELLYVTESAISKWERGITYPDITLITDICKVLEISERELVQSSDDDEYRKLKTNSDRFNKIKKTLFWTSNIFYAVALVTCFIVNLAVNHTLSWFFIVLGSLLVGYSFCPTVTWIYNKYKKLIFIGSTFISLFLLFLIISIYTNNYWFMIPTIGVLLGYFIVFYPIFIVRAEKHLDKEKYNKLTKLFLLTYSVGILLLIFLLLSFIYIYKPFLIGLGLIITGGCMSMPILFGILILLDVNKNSIKLVLLSLICLVLITIILSIGRAIYLKSTEETNSYMLEETYNKINIDVKTDNINIYLSDINKSKVVCTENKNISIEAKVVNEVLIIKRIDNQKFYDKILNFTSFKLDLYLPYEFINLLNINCSTGNIKINKGLNFNNLNIENSTGNITVLSNVTSDLNIENSTGDIIINNCDVLGNASIKTKTGNISIKNVNCKKLDIKSSTGDTNLDKVIVENDFNMKGTTGDLFLDSFDAKNMYINLSTGDVVGTILSSKFFVAKSETGNVNVPETREGGECRITVSTGNINIKYK